MTGHWGLRGVTPLLDVLFLLLFALLALSESRHAVQAETVRVRLPRVEPGQQAGASEESRIVLTLDARSRVWLEGAAGPIAGPAALDRALAARLRGRLPEEVVVEVRGDTRARHGVAVALLQHLRNRGFGAVEFLALGGAEATWGEAGR